MFHFKINAPALKNQVQASEVLRLPREHTSMHATQKRQQSDKSRAFAVKASFKTGIWRACHVICMFSFSLQTCRACHGSFPRFPSNSRRLRGCSVLLVLGGNHSGHDDCLCCAISLAIVVAASGLSSVYLRLFSFCCVVAHHFCFRTGEL